jgi:hypothetical protein
LRELSVGFDLEECAVVRSGSRRSSVSAVGENERGVSKQRRRIADVQGSGEDDDSEVETEQGTERWKLAVDEKSGRLSGLYNTYILVRPYRSLRMTFVSQAARNLESFNRGTSLLTPLLPLTLSGLKESFEFDREDCLYYKAN